LYNNLPSSLALNIFLLSMSALPSYAIPRAMLISHSCHVKSSRYSIFISSFQSSVHLIHFPLHLLNCFLRVRIFYPFHSLQTRDELGKVILLPYLQWAAVLMYLARARVCRVESDPSPLIL
jgi:hypothetical protein